MLDWLGRTFEFSLVLLGALLAISLVAGGSRGSRIFALCLVVLAAVLAAFLR